MRVSCNPGDSCDAHARKTVSAQKYLNGIERARNNARKGRCGLGPCPLGILDALRLILGRFSGIARHAYKLQSLLKICYSTRVVRSRQTIDRTLPQSRSHNTGRNIAELQACERPDETVVGCAAAVRTRELSRKILLMTIDYLIAKKWSGQNRTSRIYSTAPAI